MAKVKIAGIDIDIDAHRKNTPAERAAIFAHLKGVDKIKAAQQLEAAMQQKPETVKVETPKPQPAPPPNKQGA